MRRGTDLQRTIRIADFELPRGAVPIGTVMAMPRESWEHLRTQINSRRQEYPDSALARCRLRPRGRIHLARVCDPCKSLKILGWVVGVETDRFWHRIAYFVIIG